jgi:hypothetical protein
MIESSRAFALTMTKPHEKMGLPVPFIRQLTKQAPLLWMLLVWVMIVGCLLTYAGLITTSSARGFQLRDAESRLERLQSQARSLEMDVARASSIDTLASRAKDLGFVAVSNVESVDVAGGSYAFAR